MNIVDKKSSQLLNYFLLAQKASFKELNTIVNNTSTLTNRLQWLISHHIVRKQNRTYALTDKGKNVAAYLEEINLILKSEEPAIDPFQRIANGFIIELLRDYVSLLRRHFSERLLAVFLFGSCARGDWTNSSDIDLAIIIRNWEIPSWERTRELIPLKKLLREKQAFKAISATGHSFPITHYPLSDTDLDKFHPILMDIVLDGIILYEHENYGTDLIEQYRQVLIRKKAIRVTKPNNARYWLIGGN